MENGKYAFLFSHGREKLDFTWNASESHRKSKKVKKEKKMFPSWHFLIPYWKNKRIIYCGWASRNPTRKFVVTEGCWVEGFGSGKVKTKELILLEIVFWARSCLSEPWRRTRKWRVGPFKKEHSFKHLDSLLLSCL